MLCIFIVGQHNTRKSCRFQSRYNRQRENSNSNTITYTGQTLEFSDLLTRFAANHTSLHSSNTKTRRALDIERTLLTRTNQSPICWSGWKFRSGISFGPFPLVSYVFTVQRLHGWFIHKIISNETVIIKLTSAKEDMVYLAFSVCQQVNPRSCWWILMTFCITSKNWLIFLVIRSHYVRVRVTAALNNLTSVLSWERSGRQSNPRALWRASCYPVA